MTQTFSTIIAKICLGIILLAPFAAVYLLVDIGTFSALAKQLLPLQVQWQTVVSWQWYTLWAVTFIYVMLGVISLIFLHRAFRKFAMGEYFTYENSRNLRIFSGFLFCQALATPIHLALASVLLSFNHPAGEKMLVLFIGSNELKTVALAMVMWVISDLLVKASSIKNENQQFI